MKRFMKKWGPVVVSLMLLSGLTAETLSRPRAADAEPFHRRVRQVAQSVPLSFDGWEGTEQSVPPAAVALLRPNIIISRSYANREEGRLAKFLLVQCKDARDILGHYPPVCYPGQGWEQRSARPAEWTVAGRKVVGMEYEYLRLDQGTVVAWVVSNVLVTPDGRFARNMEELIEAAAHYALRPYGAAQIQVVVSADVQAEHRRHIVSTLLGAYAPLLDVLCSGESR